MSAPVVRTLLLCDLVGSTALAEDLGDVRMAEIVAAIDRQVRKLLADMGGQEIDKTDGFLLLFERPADAVQFAMALHVSMQERSEASGATLTYRVGIHIGEVVMWNNPAEDVARGAKPVEIEGLAKPMAARIMSLAGAGQTLLTRSAWELARRAAVGQPDDLQFATHGLYSVHGVAEPIEVYEVCPPGKTPIAPIDTAKARRYRRVRRGPLWAAAALFAVAAVVGSIGVRAWFDRDEIVEGRRWVELADGARISLFGSMEHPRDHRIEVRARIIRARGLIQEVRFETEAGSPMPIAAVRQAVPPLVTNLGPTQWYDFAFQISAVRYRYLEDGKTLDRLEYLTREDQVILIDEIIHESNGWTSHTWRTPDGAPSAIPWRDHRNTHRARVLVDEDGRLSRFEPMLGDARHPLVAAYTYRRDDLGRVVRFDSVGPNDNPRMMRRSFGASPVAIAYEYGDPNHPGVATRESALGLGDVPFAALNGCAAVSHELDDVGRPFRSFCLDTDGSRVRSEASPDGCFGWEYRPLPSGHLHVCLGEDGEPTPSASLWTMLEHALDDRGYKSAQRYRDASGNLVHSKAYIAERHYAWDDYGYIIREGPFRGVDGIPRFYAGQTWGYARQFSDSGALLQFTWLDAEGAPFNDARGVAITQWERDSSGRLVALRLFDDHSRPVNANGVHAEVQSFGDLPYPAALTLHDALGHPVSDAFGRARTQLTYDEEGEERSREYFDLEGRPILAPSPRGNKDIWCHRIERTKDGLTRRTTCMDTEGHPRLNVEGWATLEEVTSPLGDVEEVRKYDESGVLIDGPGFAVQRTEFDSAGQVIRRTVSDRDGEPTTSRNCHIWETERDDRGAPTATRCLGVDGRPVRASARGKRLTNGIKGGLGVGLGCATERVRYQAGVDVVVETHCFGESGEPILDQFGVHHTLRTNNDRGWRIAMQHFGIDGEPVLDELGVHRYKTVKDDRGRTLEQWHFGVDDRPLPERSRMTGEFDDGPLNSRIITTYNADSVVVKVQTHHRDHLGRIVFESKFDGDGKTLDSNGCEGVRYHDVGRRLASMECLDREGRLMADEGGVAVRRYDYDGETTTTLTFLGTDRQPVMRFGRYHRLQENYDRRGRLIDERWYDLEGQPALNRQGHHQKTTGHDRYDNKIAEAWFDGSGEPMMGSKGCMRIVRTVGRNGRISGTSCDD